MPSFCRHNRLVSNCPICAREQSVEMRPVVTPGGRPEPRPASPRATGASPRTTSPGRAARTGSRQGAGMTVRRLQRASDDGYASALVPGIHAIADAERLAAELAFALARLRTLSDAPPGLYAEVADRDGDPEERTWLALQIALAGPLDVEPGGDPFASVRATRVSWASGETPALHEQPFGPRGLGDADRARRTVDAYRAWAQRVGSQTAGLQGESSWSAERRFDRAFERLGTLASLERGPRFDLLVTLGRLGGLELEPARLGLGGGDPVTLAAKRILGIGDPILLERRAAELAEAAALPLAALDLGFFNWEHGRRTTGGLAADVEPDATALEGARRALGL